MQAMAGQFLPRLLQLQSFPLFLSFLFVVTMAGMWQRATKPVAMAPVLVVYNFVVSAVSAYTTVGFLHGLLYCGSLYEMVASNQMAPYFYIYWIMKNVELLDTVFIILRHKRRQLSVLHVFHHSTMLLLSEYSYRHTPWPPIAIVLFLNSFVHVFLYLYYGVCSLYPDNPPAIWMKRRLTEMQIMQFFIGLLFAGLGRVVCVYGIMYSLAMTLFFCNFYYHAYLKPKQKVNKD